ncbi:hypothetical protein [Bacillus cereus]
MLELMSKDLGLIKAEVDCMETILPLAEATNTTYRSAKQNGKVKLDMAVVYLELKDKNTKIHPGGTVEKILEKDLLKINKKRIIDSMEKQQTNNHFLNV